MKNMKYLSMMTGLVALSVSPLLAQEAADDAPAVTTTPAEVIAPIVATTPEQAKPSPEFRAYLRLLAADTLMEYATAASTLKMEGMEDMPKHIELLAGIIITNLNSTSSVALQGDEKAFVDEVSQLLPELHAIFKATDKRDMEAGRKMEAQIMAPMMMISQKYPNIIAYFDGEEGISNFVDMKKIEEIGDEASSNMSSQSPEEQYKVILKTYAKIAEMIRNNEV